MGDLGFISLLIGLVLAIYAAVGSVTGKFLDNHGLIDSARFASYLTTLALMISAFSLVGSFLSRDFELKYVFEHSSLSMPRLYTWVAIYAGNEGSLLFIATLLSVLSTRGKVQNEFFKYIIKQMILPRYFTQNIER